MRKTISAESSKKTVQKKLSDDNSNKRVLRSIIIKSEGENDSKQILEDEFDYSGNIVEPPYHQLTLCMLRENSTELQQCIDAMVVNIDGFGYRLIEFKYEDKERDKIKSEIEKEKATLETFLDNVNFEDDITSLREDTRQDLEDCGNAYWEFIPFINKKGISSIDRIIPHTIRLTKLDKNSTKINRSFFNKFTGQIEEKMAKKRFRRFVQSSSSSLEKVYFKEWGDPRNISSKTGKVIPNNELEERKRELANPVFHFKIKTNRSPYGIPRYIGNLFSIYGSRASEEINFVTFQNNNIPSMIVMVSNGQLTSGSINRVKEFIDTKVRGSNNRSSFLILEAESAEEDQLNPGTMKMDIKDLSNMQKEDQLFQDYDKNNAEKIRRVFRLPPIFVGKSDDINRSTAHESRKLADEQVFNPKRNKFDKTMNKILIKEFGMKYHTFKSNSANVTNDEDLVGIISGAEKTGGVTPNLARSILGDILNVDIPDYDEKKIDFDPNIPMSLTLVERAKVIAGNSVSGKLAPNQGQIPKQEVDAEKILKAIERMITVDIYKEIFEGINDAED